MSRVDEPTRESKSSPHAGQEGRIAAFLARPLLARLATAQPTTLQPHVVPVWFLWKEGALWLSVFESTRKARELHANPRCSIVVDTDSPEDGLSAVLLEGTAVLITAPRDFVEDVATRIYTRYMGAEGVLAADPQSWIHDPENTIVKLVPRKVYTW